MKKKLLLMLAFALAMSFQAWADVEINETNFPDGAFRTYVAQFDTDNNGAFSQEELDAVTTFYCINKGITSLDGMHFFQNLSVITANQNQITSIDASQNLKLTQIIAIKNNLNNVNVSQNLLLKVLAISTNAELTTLDVSNNPALESIEIAQTGIETIDLTQNQALTALYAYECPVLKTILLPATSTLTNLSNIWGNPMFESIDLSVLPELSKLNVNGGALTNLDISQNPMLVDLCCRDNQLSSLDLSNCPNLDRLLCSGMENLSFDLSYVPNLRILDCSFCNLQELNLSENTKLKELYCSGNGNLQTLDLSNCPELGRLNCGSCKLQELDLSNNNDLTDIDCGRNEITNFVLPTDPTKLNLLFCNDNRIESLDLSEFFGLTEVSCRNNQLTELLIGTPNLQQLWCDNNQLTKLDLTGCYAQLQNAFCHNNKLKELHIPAINNLTIFNNQLRGEAMDEIVLTRLEYFRDYFVIPQNTWVINSNDPNEGNIMDYTQASTLNNLMGFANVYDFLGNVEDLIPLANQYDWMNQSVLYDGSASVVLNDQGLATFSHVVDYDLDNVYNATAYIVNQAEGNRAQIEETSGLMIAGTGVVFYGEPGEEIFVPTAMDDMGWDQGWEPFGNLLAGNVTQRTFAAGEAYILKGGKFVLTQGDREELPYHTAYLPADVVVNGAAVLYLVGDGFTGVEDVIAPVNEENAPIFDVLGRRVINPQAGGVYIQNGKKFIQR